MRFSCLRRLGLHAVLAGIIVLPARADERAAAPAAGTAVAVAAAQSTPASNLLEHVPSERLSKAMGHFSRAHALLASAIEEFDRGYQLADPSSLMDVQQFRGNLVDRSTDLEHLLDPQPRISKSGVAYQGDSRLLVKQDKK